MQNRLLCSSHQNSILLQAMIHQDKSLDGYGVQMMRSGTQGTFPN
jgi:hypothetical protein